MTTATESALVTIDYDAKGNIIDVCGLTYRDAAKLHDWLGNHRLSCDNPDCTCWAAGYQAALERRCGE